MYLGKIVELLEAQQIFSNGRHPYLQALVESAPVTDPALRRKRRVIPGETPSPLHLPSGCAFHPRCPHKISRCTTECPALSVQKGFDDHLTACHLA
jgi:oligopeptide/dipeptide ABC transporter ATP-binding protein